MYKNSSEAKEFAEEFKELYHDTGESSVTGTQRCPCRSL